MDPAKQRQLEDALTLMSRAIRDKLDLVGIKLHLEQWQALDLEERARLRDTPCASTADVDRYRALVEELVRARTGKEPDRMPPRGAS